MNRQISKRRRQGIQAELKHQARCGERKTSLVKCAATDRASDPVIEQAAQGANILEAGDTAGSDNRHTGKAGGSGEHPEVGASLSTVAGDISQDNRSDARLAETECGFSDRQLTCLDPPLDSEAAVARIKRAKDAAGEAIAGIIEQIRIEEGSRANGDIVGTGGDHFVDRVKRAEATADVDRAGDGGANRTNGAEIARLTVDRAVEVNDMDLLGALVGERFGDGCGVGTVDSRASHVALDEAHDFPEFQVNRGNNSEVIKQISYESVPLVDRTPDRRGSRAVA